MFVQIVVQNHYQSDFQQTLWPTHFNKAFVELSGPTADYYNEVLCNYIDFEDFGLNLDQYMVF